MNAFRHGTSHVFLALVATIGLLLLTPARAGLVISQVYGGGGNTGATYTHDFVELFNDGPIALSLNGLSVQYASATGIGLFGAATNLRTDLPNVLLQPWHYFLIQEAQGAGGTTPLPTPEEIADLPPDEAAQVLESLTPEEAAGILAELNPGSATAS